MKHHGVVVLVALLAVEADLTLHPADHEQPVREVLGDDDVVRLHSVLPLLKYFPPPVENP